MTKRPYSSPLRIASSAETRDRILAAAQHCFERQGFTGTTMRAIAVQAGVSLESVNIAGVKRVLLMAAFRRARCQDKDVRLLDMPEPKALFADEDPIAAVSKLIIWVANRNERISRLWRAFEQAADTDAEIQADYDDFMTKMRAETLRAVHELDRRGALRKDMSDRELSELLWVTVLPDHHRRLCDQAGWSQARYQQWLVRSAVTLLLPPSSIEADSRPAEVHLPSPSPLSPKP